MWSNLKLLIDKISYSIGLRPFGWLGNLFGIFQCRFAGNRLKSGNRFVRIYVFVLFGLRLYFRITSIYEIVLPPPLLTKIIIVLTCVSLVAVETAVFVIAAFFDKSLIAFFDKLAIYDDRVAKLGNTRQDVTRTYWICLLLSIAFALWAMISNSDSVTWTKFGASELKFLIQEYTYLIGILKFNLLVHLTYQRFRHLNKKIMPSVSWTRELVPPSYLRSVTSYDVIFLHATLADATTILTRLYSIPLLYWFTNLLFTAVLYAYNAACITWHEAMPFCTVLLAEIVLTCTVCSSTAEEANNMGKYMSKDKPILVEDSIAMDRVRMQLYLLNSRVVFSAGDFFEIKLSLLYSMIISIATYGVLLTSYHKKQSTTDESS